MRRGNGRRAGGDNRGAQRGPDLGEREPDGPFAWQEAEVLADDDRHPESCRGRREPRRVVDRQCERLLHEHGNPGFEADQRV